MARRIFKRREFYRGCENFGRVDYTVTETIEETETGLRVTSHARGVSEGDPVDQHSVAFWPGVTLERASDWRLRNGYTEVTDGAA